jgi:hypothetical protein
VRNSNLIYSVVLFAALKVWANISTAAMNRRSETPSKAPFTWCAGVVAGAFLVIDAEAEAEPRLTEASAGVCRFTPLLLESALKAFIEPSD